MIHEEIMEKYSTLSNKELKDEIVIFKKEICWQVSHSTDVDKKDKNYIMDKYEIVRFVEQMFDMEYVLENRGKND